MMNDKLPCVGLNRYAEARLKSRHPWIFSNELSDPKHLARIPAGSLVDVLDCHGNYVGTGMVNPKSLIAVRFLSRERGETIDQKFFEQKLWTAISLREPIFGKNTSSRGTYRAVFGESDGLPGLIIDRFDGAWVVEPHAFGMNQMLPTILEALSVVAKEFLQEEKLNVIVRTDHRAAALEGMEARAEVVRGEIPHGGIWAVEDELRFPVDPLKGQKTGFFFDQRENRSYFQNWVNGTSSLNKNYAVLDLYCHAGAWGLRALKAGARKAIFVDSSEAALEGVRRVAIASGFGDKAEFFLGDAVTFLKEEKRTFHAIALDPPALVPNKKSLAQGAKLYREVNEAAMRLVTSGGVLSTSSCSYHLEEERFEEVVHRSVLASEQSARVLHRGGLSSDHPMLTGMPEGRYLKNLFLAFS